jgi:hypothetical protein
MRPRKLGMCASQPELLMHPNLANFGSVLALRHLTHLLRLFLRAAMAALALVAVQYLQLVQVKQVVRYAFRWQSLQRKVGRQLFKEGTALVDEGRV